MAYNHKEIEKNLYDFWLKNKLFDPIKKTSCSKNFSIILPPPNVTGHLHLGHAWGSSIQDCIIRYKKIQGFRTLFIPGTDHAGIATQTKFEKILEQNKIDRKKISDEEFLIQLKIWALKQAKHIESQWASLGLSLSYKYNTFTLDKNVSDLISLEFKKLYDQGLIYQAYKLVNWDVKLKTAVSDLENIKKETKGIMWYFKYYLEGSKNEFLTVATTRPETMFADTNLVVNPKDKRFKKYLNKKFINPVNNDKLPLISDKTIEMDFGTGVMKCTPAHSFDDYEIAKKHKIVDFNSCINMDGKLNQWANTKLMNFEGVDRIEARELIALKLEKMGLLIKKEQHINNVGYSERSGEIIEPLLSLQWFVKMKPIVENVKKLLIKNPPSFFPPRFKKTLEEWLKKTNDWCISRQLLWGHKIPVWYHKKNKSIYVNANPPKNEYDYVRDTKVLDTWFSSGLWPLATTKFNAIGGISDFYPISMLVTGWDIIFFWVARMLFQCSVIDASISLKSILLTGLIRDENNKKMSKSVGNVVDPDAIIEEYGADALRATLISGSPNGEDLIFKKERLIYNRNFINKIWNANNLVIKNNENNINFKKIDFINSWIINELHKCIHQYINNMEKYNFSIIWKEVVNFSWEIFANTYLEIAKTVNDDETRKVVNYVYKNILIMIHPFMPFISEYIYHNKYFNKKSIMLETLKKQKINNVCNEEAELFIDIYSNIKTLRIKNNIKNTKIININIVTTKNINIVKLNKYLNNFSIFINNISNIRNTEIKETIILKKYTFEILTAISSKKEEIIKNENLLRKLKLELERCIAILSNQDFIKKAPKEKVLLEENKQRDYQRQYEQVKAIIRELKKED